MAGTAQPYNSPVVQTSGTTFAQLQAGGLAAVLDNLIAANPALADPTVAPTVAVTGGGASGGTLPAGVYFVSYAWVNGTGSTIAKEVASSFTVGATNIPRVTVPALPTGAAATHIYLTAAGGATGTETYYGSTTGTTFDITIATFANPLSGQPTVNTTALTSLASFVNAARNGQHDKVYRAVSEALSNFLRGDPIVLSEAMGRIHQLAAVFKALQVATDDAAALVFANTGTLGTYSVSPGNLAAIRTFP